MSTLENDFLAALKLVASNQVSQAKEAFERILATDPQGDLADDALCNLGILALNQNQIPEAEEIFLRLIKDYPEATIAEYPGSNEHGLTGAKALLGLVNCALARGEPERAKEYLGEFDRFRDSWVMVGETKKPYQALAQELIETWESAAREFQEQAR